MKGISCNGRVYDMDSERFLVILHKTDRQTDEEKGGKIWRKGERKRKN